MKAPYAARSEFVPIWIRRLTNNQAAAWAGFSLSLRQLGGILSVFLVLSEAFGIWFTELKQTILEGQLAQNRHEGSLTQTHEDRDRQIS